MVPRNRSPPGLVDPIFAKIFFTGSSGGQPAFLNRLCRATTAAGAAAAGAAVS